MLSVDFDTQKYQTCYDEKLLPSQQNVLKEIDFEALFANIENTQSEVKQESFAGIFNKITTIIYFDQKWFTFTVFY